jgi:two-component system, cell cycle sensor histidine kinase and response regulator CckA
MRVEPGPVAWLGEDRDPTDRGLSGHSVTRFALSLESVEAVTKLPRFETVLVSSGDRERTRSVVAAIGRRAAVVVLDRAATPASVEELMDAGADIVVAHDDPITLSAAVASARAALRARSALAVLAGALDTGVWVTDSRGRSLFESDAAAALGTGAAPSASLVPRADGSTVDAVPAGASDEPVQITDDRGADVPVQRLTRVVDTAAGRLGVVLHRSDAARVEMERKLVLAQKLETVNQLSRGVIHDLNNAFCIIQSFADLLMEATDPADESYADIEEISRASVRAATMTRSLSSFQKRGSGQVESVNVQDQLRKLEPLARRLLGERTELAIHAPRTATVLCDPALFEQGVLDAIAILRPQESGGVLALSVSDDDRWVTLKLTGKLDESAGARVQALTSVMSFAGGEAQSTSDGLELKLPKSTRNLGDKAPRAQAAETILIVEDERPVRIAMSRVLESLGYQVLEARRTADAKTFALGRSIDLIVSDVVLPDGDGIALLEELRSSAPAMRGMLVTGYDTSELGARGRNLPILMKPFTTLELARKVRQALDA